MRHGDIKTGAINLPTTDGSADQVIKTNGSGILSFATPSAGAMSLVTSHNITESESNFVFSSLAGDTAGLYIIYFMVRFDDNNNIRIQFNNDTNNNYYMAGSGAGYFPITSHSYDTTNYWASGNVFIQASPWKDAGYPFVYWKTACNIGNTGYGPNTFNYDCGFYNSGTEITSIKIYKSGGNWTNGCIKLFKVT